jgi:hypothetical protein
MLKLNSSENVTGDVLINPWEVAALVWDEYCDRTTIYLKGNPNGIRVYNTVSDVQKRVDTAITSWKKKKEKV